MDGIPVGSSTGFCQKLSGAALRRVYQDCLKFKTAQGFYTVQVLAPRWRPANVVPASMVIVGSFLVTDLTSELEQRWPSGQSAGM